MTLKEILPILDGELLNEGNIKKPIGKFCVDTRKLQKHDVFIALEGESVDGHQYIQKAIHKKVRGIIVSKRVAISTNIPIILVEDTKKALLLLAHYIRDQYADIPVIAVTGSVGKTTTKEMISSILATKYQVLKSEGSYNNHIGIPLTMFDITPNTEIVVQEMGMNHLQEIDMLSKICKPNTSVITCIGSAHIGYLKSKKNILKAKLEIVNGMEQGELIVNGDDPYLQKIRLKKQKVILCGTKKKHSLQAYDVQKKLQSLSFKIYLDQEYHVMLPICGHLLPDVLLAIEVGLLYEVPISSILRALEQLTLPMNRANVCFLENGTQLIADCYNASYESVISILKEVQDLEGEKVLIMGDILELGKHSKGIHKKIGKFIRKMKDTKCYFIGEHMKVAHFYVKNSVWFLDTSMFLDAVSIEEFMGKIVLVKGSHRLYLDKIVEQIGSYSK